MMDAHLKSQEMHTLTQSMRKATQGTSSVQTLSVSLCQVSKLRVQSRSAPMRRRRISKIEAKQDYL